MGKPTTAALILLVAGTAAVGPAAITPPEGARLLLSARAEGVQIYACEGEDQGFAWVFKAPEATLIDRSGGQAIRHFGGPSWQLADGTIVVDEVVAEADAPQPDSIPWLLLKAKSVEGAGVLAQASFIRRIETKGGTPPDGGCNQTDTGREARIRYSAWSQPPGRSVQIP